MLHILHILHILHVEPILIIFCALMGVPLAVQSARSNEGALQADADRGVFARLVGPVALNATEHEEGATTHDCGVLDEVFPIGLPSLLQLAKSDWAVVEYLPHSRRVLEMRSGTGACVD
jgi:hypothetical protein